MEYKRGREALRGKCKRGGKLRVRKDKGRKRGLEGLRKGKGRVGEG